MPKNSVDYEIDEMAVQAFETIGFKRPFPAELVSVYKRFKLCRDKLTPGRLTAEGYAAVTVIAELEARLAKAERKPDKDLKEG
jgi:hypothetical protein